MDPNQNQPYPQQPNQAPQPAPLPNQVPQTAPMPEMVPQQAAPAIAPAPAPDPGMAPQQVFATAGPSLPPTQGSTGGESLGQRIGEFFNFAGPASKKDFLNGFIISIVTGFGALIVGIIFFVVAGVIGGIEIEDVESKAERPEYTSLSEFTDGITYPLRSNYDDYDAYAAALSAYNAKYKEATKKYNDANDAYEAKYEEYKAAREKENDQQQAKENTRDGFAQIFTSLGVLTLAFAFLFSGGSMWALLVRRLRDAGVSVKSLVLVLALPIIIGELTFIASQFIAPDAGAKAIANILLLDIEGYFKALQPLVIVNLIGILLAGAITVATLIVCFARNTSDIKGRSFISVLKG